MRILKWAGKIFLILFLLILIFISGAAILVELPLVLAFGWIVFLRDNIVRLTLNPLRVAEAAACIAVLGLGGHFFARWLYRQMVPDAVRAWRPGWTAAGLGAVLLLFVAGVGTIGITHQAAWLFTDPNPLVANGYTDYTTRARISEVIISASAARTLVGEMFARTGHLPDSEVAAPRPEEESRYVRKISIGAGGVVQIEVADVIQKDGVITLTPTPKDGKLEWKCSSENVRKAYLPSTCRN